MMPNLVDLFIVAVIGLSIVSGMYKGFISSMLAAAGFVGAWFGALHFYPTLANMILSNNGLMHTLRYYLDMSNMFKTPALSTTPVASIVSDAAALNSAMNELTTLPAVLKEVFRVNVQGQLFSVQQVKDALGNISEVPWLSTFADYLNQTIWAAAINVISFVVLFAVLYLVATLLVNLLNSVFHFPILRHFDWFLGGLFGAARGYVIVLLILTVIPLVLDIVNLQEITDIFNGSLLMPYFPKEFTIPDIVRNTFQTAVQQPLSEMVSPVTQAAGVVPVPTVAEIITAPIN